MSQVGQQGWSGPPNGGGYGGFGNFGSGHGSGSGVNGHEQALSDEAVPVEAFLGAESLGSTSGWYLLPIGSEYSIPIPLAALPSIFESIWDDLFGRGNSAPPIPYQMRHHRHPIYPILGIADDLTPTQASEAIQLIQSIERPPPPELHAAPSGALSFSVCEGLFLSLTAPAVMGCGVYGSLCLGGGLPACGLAAGTCLPEAAGLIGCYSQAHGGQFPDFGEHLPPGERTPEAPTPPLQR
jgi:hypothetical protein